MYCNHCGTKIPDGAKFCQNCGKPTVAPAVETVAAPTEETQNAVGSVKWKKTVQKSNLGEKKLFGKLPLKWMLVILGGVAVLILSIVLISNAVEEKKRTTILGTIPDPETFFGVSGDHVRYDSWYEHNIEFETKDVTKDMTDAYVDLLCSSEFPFTLTDTIDHFGGGMVRYIFEYNGSQELYDAQSLQIMVEYNPGYEQVVVNIRNSGNFELVPAETYNSSGVPALAYAPDPEFFFNTGAAEKGDSSMTLVLSGSPGAAVFEYISVLKDSYGMTEVDSYTQATTWQWCLQKGGNENATVSIGLDTRDDGDWDLSFIFGENVTLLQAEALNENTGNPAPEPTPQPTPAISSRTLPNLRAFLGGVAAIEDKAATVNGHKEYYELDIDDGLKAGQEYLKLLEKYGFVLSNEIEDTVLYLTTTVYYFDYVGDGKVNPVEDRYHMRDWQEFSCDALLIITKNTRDKYTGINIYYSNDLTVADNGDRASTAPGGASGGGGSNGTNSDNYDTRRPCSICDRTGDCTKCGGDGYLWSSASGKEDRNCTKCRNHNGKCTYCDGKGWID